MKLLIPVAFGLESVVKRQLNTLGYGKAPAFHGRIGIEGDWADVARLNLCLRSGERVLIELGNFTATTFDELFDGVYALPWEEFLTPRSQILMDGKSYQSKLGAIKASGGVAKKAIIKRLTDKFHLSSRGLAEDGAKTVVGVSLYQDEVSITVDTSGEGLHKRGYRSLAYTAPLKETLAAGLIDMTYYFPDKAFADPFCGSGTLPIEAAIKALNIAPGLNRDFDFLHWKCTPKGVFEQEKQRAKDLQKRDIKLQIFGGDINERAISIAQFHAKRAGVEKHIIFRVADMARFSATQPRGVLVCNPPYGERLENPEEVKTLYQTLGKTFRALPDWNGYILTGLPDFERYFGKRASKTKKIYNANIECGFYCYESSKPKKENV